MLKWIQLKNRSSNKTYNHLTFVLNTASLLYNHWPFRTFVYHQHGHSTRQSSLEISRPDGQCLISQITIFPNATQYVHQKMRPTHLTADQICLYFSRRIAQKVREREIESFKIDSYIFVNRIYISPAPWGADILYSDPSLHSYMKSLACMKFKLHLYNK